LPSCEHCIPVRNRRRRRKRRERRRRRQTPAHMNGIGMREEEEFPAHLVARGGWWW